MKNIRELFIPNKWFNPSQILLEKTFKTEVKQIRIKGKNKTDVVRKLRNFYPRLKFISFKFVNNCLGGTIQEDRNNREIEILIIPDGDLVWRE
jgi:hypothetical protein